MAKTIYKLKGLDCASCATMIELDLEDAGVKAKCSFKDETLEIEDEKVDEKKIIDIVKDAGYDITSQ